MKHVKTLARMILPILLLTSCSAKNNGEALALKIRASLLETTALTLTAVITADYGDRVYDFTVQYTGGADKGDIDILAPQEIAGLKAHVSISGGTLEYDGAILDTGALTKNGLSPAEAVPLLLSQWQRGYISGCNYENLGDTKALAVTTDISETITQRTWFDVKTLLPLRSELNENGKMVLACVFENVTVGP
ncbi:hypothetical protein AAFA46_07535 [Oscillospiraceae bacterium WX1]